MNAAVFRHIIFWVLTTLLLTLYFGRSGEYLQSFYFTTFMLPVALATTYLFNYYLVPKYLLTQRYWKFGLYCFYTLVFSMYLEMLVMMLAFVVLANYEYNKMNPLTVDIFGLSVTLYLIVFLIAFVRLVRSLQNSRQEQKILLRENEKNQATHLHVKSDRKTVPIQLNEITYIESLADYVKINTHEKVVITKEKISKLHQELPDNFLRVHRSFIVNKFLVDSFSKENLKINGTEIPISRTYKTKVWEKLD